MKTPILSFFKKMTAKKSPSDRPPHHKSASPSDLIFKAMPSWWMVLFAYALALLFCDLAHRFFVWFPPYLQEVFKNMRGLPMTWADIGLYWGEFGLKTIAIAAAVYHHLWQLGTRYELTTHNIKIESWFPLRRVTAVPYGSVRKAGYQQNLLGLIFNYGHIEIDTGSLSGPLFLLNCPAPRKFLGLLQPKVESVVQPSLAHHRRSSDPESFLR